MTSFHTACGHLNFFTLLADNIKCELTGSLEKAFRRLSVFSVSPALISLCCISKSCSETCSDRSVLKWQRETETNVCHYNNGHTRKQGKDYFSPRSVEVLRVHCDHQKITLKVFQGKLTDVMLMCLCDTLLSFFHKGLKVIIYPPWMDLTLR